MFKKGLLRRNWIYSDEGFSVQVLRRDCIVYRESARRMAVTADTGLHDFAVLVDTIGRWDDDPLNLLVPEEQERIAFNIKRALESQGTTCSLLRPEVPN
jgi:hypothetical protein